MPKLESEPDSLIAAWLRQTGKVLGLRGPINNPLQLANLVGRGLEASVIGRLIARGLSENLVFRNIIKRRTYQHRLEGNQNLTPDESDRAERAASLLSLATLVFDDQQKALSWLNTPKQQFEDRAPMDLAGSSVGAKLVEEVLLRAYYGLSA